MEQVYLMVAPKLFSLCSICSLLILLLFLALGYNQKALLHIDQWHALVLIWLMRLMPLIGQRCSLQFILTRTWHNAGEWLDLDGQPSLLLMRCDDSVPDSDAFIESQTGVRQGDPLAALL